MAPLAITVRSRPAASPLEMEVAQSFSKVALFLEEVQEGARTRIRRISASSEMFTRVEDGCDGATVVILLCIFII